MEIIANERIKSLEKFYARDASNSKNIIEENYKSKKTTDDAKGIWVTEQLKAAAVTLHGSQFSLLNHWKMEGRNSLKSLH